MATDEQLKRSAVIAIALINQAVVDEQFARRIRDRITRFEAFNTKRKYDIISLSVISSLIVLTSIFLGIAAKFSPFLLDSYVVPVIILGLVILVGTFFVIEYYLVKKKGTENLQIKIKKSEWKTTIRSQQKIDTPTYNQVRDSFESIKTIESKYMLSGFILKYALRMETLLPIVLQPEIIFRYLMLISANKKPQLKKLIETEEDITQYLAYISGYLRKYLLILDTMVESNKLPIYFINNIQKIKQGIEEYKQIEIPKEKELE
ncbi:MAG: hypothetical protein KGD59_05190 [Candidatus Heimdallarchaeota archaeon]|nr:hypothetical protein [Candidatus Heimdallarchaeota archaeon]MBY8993924.1 hypothetical protein [Candidatus Heimdallarchaeota archaeon]